MADLNRGADALVNFRRRIDDLLKELESGDAGNAKVGLERVTRASFSGGGMPFAEADGFFQQYNRVHRELVALSKSLGDQIELLRIGVHAADVGYDNVDEETRRRFHAIQTRLAEQRRETEQRERDETRHDGTSGTKDLG
ncbi:hypothetical protein [Streptomyces zingiberis]|uniref:Conjugal transfer protein TraB n=1 Tax=Streptomyces zingiberis TaxID=2053010 RepID=A0ABX1C0M8_9ACTN|nr:hypothetical protein [Streptomyces zingiberis]NJQ02225.1 hypothetical protein [Streptomyces zingiberis]